MVRALQQFHKPLSVFFGGALEISASRLRAVPAVLLE